MKNTESKCGACGRGSESPICWGCAKALRHRLVTDPGLPWMMSRLSEQAYGQSTLNRGKMRRGNDPAPMPLDVRAADLLREINTALAGWAVRLGGHDVRDQPAAVHAHYIARHIGEVMLWDDAPAILQSVEAFTFRAFRAINRPPEVYLGPCDAELDSGEVCGAELLAEYDADFVNCGRCKTVHSVETIRAQVWERAGREPLPAVAIAKVLHLVGFGNDDDDLARAIGFAWPTTYLHPDGQRRQVDAADAVPLYRLSEVVDLLNDAAESRTRRRRRRSDQHGKNTTERTSA